ncbi:MAG: electron transport complex subunit RsxC [Gammaproteobacteria bacterium]|nr:electron transport complex subunit RsxC [Gammaproteobacteria bacterium]
MSVIHQSKYSLTGGIHLPENKSQSSVTDLQICPIPEQLMIPLNLHAATDAKAIVNVGDQIKFGDNIAESTGIISAMIHSPVDGQIAEICNRPVANRSELDELVLIINCNNDCNNSTAATENPKIDWFDQKPEQLLETIKLAGIVGLGGAGFPSHQKLDSGRLESHTLLLNGAECEPYISCDDLTMRNYGCEVLEGALILARSLNCQIIQIAIEDNKPEAIKTMASAIEQYQQSSPFNVELEVIEIPTLYPSGGERQLLEIVTGKQVPSGSFPSALGYTVQNVGTTLAVYEAVVFNKPLIDRIVTITGDAVARPGNYRVIIGTPIRYLLEFAQWDESKCETLIHGGPMMGFPIADPDRPISKISNCIIASSAEEFPKPLPEQPCIRCGKCAEVCPASLLPQQLLWFSKSGEIDKAKDFKLLDCIECGACAYVCPSQIPLVDYYRFTKGELRAQSAAKVKSDKAKQRFDFRNQRLENEELAKQLLRDEKAKQRAAKKKNDSVDPNKQAVADALARVQAKKKAKLKGNRDV